MRLYPRVDGNIPLDRFRANRIEAERKIATQVERDCRAYIPSRRIAAGGQVYGNRVVWKGQLVRMFYFGKLYVDPVTKVGGFPTDDGWMSRPGVQKVRSGRDIHFRSGVPFWFNRAKDANLESWLRIAREELNRG